VVACQAFGASADPFPAAPSPDATLSPLETWTLVILIQVAGS
jgi:hypothetical protein